jgi:hypothetical protein
MELAPATEVSPRPIRQTPVQVLLPQQDEDCGPSGTLGLLRPPGLLVAWPCSPACADRLSVGTELRRRASTTSGSGRLVVALGAA